jgi:hypothetical protein
MLLAFIGGINPFQIIVIDAEIGSVVSKVKDNGYFSGLGGSVTIDPVSNTIFLAGTTPGSFRLSIMLLDILSLPPNLGPYTTIQLSSYNFVT